MQAVRLHHKQEQPKQPRTRITPGLLTGAPSWPTSTPRRKRTRATPVPGRAARRRGPSDTNTERYRAAYPGGLPSPEKDTRGIDFEPQLSLDQADRRALHHALRRRESQRALHRAARCRQDDARRRTRTEGRARQLPRLLHHRRGPDRQDPAKAARQGRRQHTIRFWTGHSSS